jgi:hypothetical protein
VRYGRRSHAPRAVALAALRFESATAMTEPDQDTENFRNLTASEFESPPPTRLYA